MNAPDLNVPDLNASDLNASDLDLLPALPRQDGEPVFRAPWEAKAFALAVSLHAKGLFTWPEWAAALAAEIRAAQAAGDPDRGETYYRHWLAALERLVVEKGAVSAEQLVER